MPVEDGKEGFGHEMNCSMRRERAAGAASGEGLFRA
jgi:hypothetical protein